jgi:predicted membrane-bound spermidine synthase
MRKLLYTTVFFSGLTSLAVEMAASRLLGNFFGTSNLVWASIIGLILIYLTVGYFLGGWWADRSPYFSTFFRVLVWGAFTVGLIPLISRPILRLASDAFSQYQLGTLFGSFTAVMVLFSIPVTLLGTASPFAIRLAIEDTRQAGKISGRIYAISTLGSFLGTFLPTLVLIPLIGTYRTFLVISGLLLIIAFYGLWRTVNLKAVLLYLWMPLILVLLAIFGTLGTDKSTPGLVYEGESAYNYIQVQNVDGYTLLKLNEGEGYHSIYKPDQLFYGGPWEQVLAAPFYNAAPYSISNVKRIAIVGLAAGTTARQATAVYGKIPIDGYEIDPVIVDVARKYFDMNESNLNVIIQDGRVGLEHSTNKYQIISVDAYRPPYIPWQLTTREFFQIVYNHLTPDGTMAINVGRSLTDRSLINGLYNTICSVFPSAYIVDIPNTFNSIIYATVQPTDSANLAANYEVLSNQQGINPLLLQVLQVALENSQPSPGLNPSTVYTDDRAPIEWITNRLILDFVFSDQVEKLQ